MAKKQTNNDDILSKVSKDISIDTANEVAKIINQEDKKNTTENNKEKTEKKNTEKEKEQRKNKENKTQKKRDEKRDKLLKEIKNQTSGGASSNKSVFGTSRLGAFADTLSDEIKDSTIKQTKSILQTFNPLEHVKSMWGMLPGSGAIGKAFGAATSDFKKEEKEDTKINEDGLEVSEENSEKLTNINTTFSDGIEKIYGVLETIKESFIRTKETTSNKKLLAKENANENKKLLRGIGRGGVVAGGGAGGDKKSFGEQAMDLGKDAAKLTLIQKMGGWALKLGKGLLGGVVGMLGFKGLASTLKGGGAAAKATASAATKGPGIISRTLGGVKNLIFGKSFKGGQFLPGGGRAVAGGQRVGGLVNWIKNAAGVSRRTADTAKILDKTSKAYRAGLQVKRAADLAKAAAATKVGVNTIRAARIAAAGGTLGLSLVAEGVWHGGKAWERNLLTKSRGTEQTLGQGWEKGEDGVVYDKETGVVLQDPTKDHLGPKGQQPKNEEDVKKNIKMNRGKAQLEVNEKMIGMRIDEALEFRKLGEDELANASMLAATKLLKQRKNIIANMGFRDYEEAKKWYSLSFSDVGEKLRNLTSSEGNWDWMEIEDNRYKNNLKKAFENTSNVRGTLSSFAAIENEERMYQANLKPQNALGIESAPNIGLGAALVNQTQQKIMGMPQAQNATDKNENVVAINQPVNNVTNNTSNIAQGQGDSRLNEPAFNQTRNEERNGSMF
jgi:hypothetical protein